jgi:hypothetical protein
MANIKVSELTEASSFDDGDYTMIVQANQNKKISKENIFYNISTNISNLQNNLGNIQNLETQTKDNAVNSINELNSTRLRKLWENPDPTVNFSAQNITLSSADYDYLKWFYKKGRNDDSLMSIETLKGYGATLNGSGLAHISGSSNYVGSAYTRICTRVSDTEYSVPEATVNVGNSTTAGTDTTFYLIPIAVYGGKF